jgi:RNA polymerase sigma factor (sigma-70 family)
MTAMPSFEQIEREFGPMIRRVAFSYEANAAMAEELVQDMWLALWRALPTFRGESSLRTFVARVATSCAITHVRNSIRVPVFGTAGYALRVQAGKPPVLSPAEPLILLAVLGLVFFLLQRKAADDIAKYRYLKQRLLEEQP